MPQSRLALITFVDGGSPDNSLPGTPDNSLPGWNRPVDPGYGRPTYPGGHPGQGLPGLPPFAVQLPVFPFDPTRPDNSLPGGGTPDNSLPGGGYPDNSLPTPGRKYIVKWLACVGLILVPDNSLPSGPPNRPDNELPEFPEPK